MLEIIGWIGSVCFALCAAPQAYQSFKNKHSNGVNLYMLFLWSVGAVCSLIYIVPDWKWPLIFNYSLNILWLSIIYYYRFK